MREALKMTTSVVMGHLPQLKGGIRVVFSMVCSTAMESSTGKMVVNIEETIVVA